MLPLLSLTRDGECVENKHDANMAVILFPFLCNQKCILVTVKCHLAPNKKIVESTSATVKKDFRYFSKELAISFCHLAWSQKTTVWLFCASYLIAKDCKSRPASPECRLGLIRADQCFSIENHESGYHTY